MTVLNHMRRLPCLPWNHPAARPAFHESKLVGYNHVAVTRDGSLGAYRLVPGPGTFAFAQIVDMSLLRFHLSSSLH